MKEKQSIKELLGREFLHDREHKALTRIIQGEQAAVETYNLAIDKIKDRELLPILENCRDSHQARIDTLSKRMQELGDAVPESAGWRGTVAGIVESGATILGDRVAMSVLAAGEEFGNEECAEQMKELDSDTYELMEEEILPAQHKTLETMTILCSWMKAEQDEHLKVADQAPDYDKQKEGPLSINDRAKVLQNRGSGNTYDPFWFG